VGARLGEGEGKNFEGKGHLKKLSEQGGGRRSLLAWSRTSRRRTTQVTHQSMGRKPKYNASFVAKGGKGRNVKKR